MAAILPFFFSLCSVLAFLFSFCFFGRFSSLFIMHTGDVFWDRSHCSESWKAHLTEGLVEARLHLHGVYNGRSIEQAGA